jgi:flavin prenyltransferase
MQRPRLIVGISGATGIIYGVRLLQVARVLQIETHLIVTKAGERTLAYETDVTIQELRSMADHTYPDADIGADKPPLGGPGKMLVQHDSRRGM